MPICPPLPIHQDAPPSAPVRETTPEWLSIDSSFVVTEIEPPFPLPQVPLLMNALLARVTVSAVTVTDPAGPVTTPGATVLGSTLEKSPVPVGRPNPSIRRSCAFTSIDPAGPDPKLVL